MARNLLERYWELDLATLQRPQWRRVMCFGDSWFQYPGKVGDASDIPRELARHYKKTLFFDEGLAGRDRKSFEIGRKRVLRAIGDFAFDVLLISHGGNDIVGPDMRTLVKAKDTPQAAGAVSGGEPQNVVDYIDLRVFNQRLKSIRNDYLELIVKAAKESPQCKVVLHGYAYVIPNGKTFKLGPIEQGPWVHKHLKRVGLRAVSEQKIVTDWMLDRLAALQTELAANHAHVEVVRSLAALPLESDWDNEIHPTKSGFRRLVERHWTPVLDPLLT